MNYKKQMKIEVLLILVVMLFQLISPIIAMAKEDELVTIQFQDVNMYNKMVSELVDKISSKNDTNMTINITQENIDKIVSLDLQAASIENIAGIEYFTNLNDLLLDNNNITDISSLKNLTELGSLWIEYNQISDISALKSLTKLYSLRIEANQISDISVLSSLTLLSDLNLGQNHIKDISALSGLTRLTDLQIHCNQVSNINSLSELTDLKRLALDGNKISDISVLSKFSGLMDLCLYDTQIEDISVLSKLNNLAILDLGKNPIKDLNALVALNNLESLLISDMDNIDINSISEITSLKSLHLNNTKISDISALNKLKNLEWLELNSNKISDISALDSLENLESLELQDNIISQKGAIGDTIKLPQIFLEAQNESSKIYSSSGLKFENCKLNDTKDSIIIEALPATITIKSGSAKESKFEINETGEKKDKEVEKITINILPSKKQYIESKDSLDVTDGSIKVIFDDKSEQIISMTNDMITGFDNTKIGKQTLTVNYEGKNVTFEIEVIEAPKEEKKEFVLGRDNNSFLHSNSFKSGVNIGFYGVDNYQISEEYYNILTKNATQGEKEEIISREHEEWEGSCFGISALEGLLYYNKIDLSSIQDDAKDFYNLPLPYKNEEFLNLIQSYYLSQFLNIYGNKFKEYWRPRILGLVTFEDTNDYDDLSGFLEDFVNVVQNEIVQFDYGYKTSKLQLAAAGHSILALGCEKLDDGSYKVKLYDMNSVKETEPQGKFYYMTISSDFSEFNLNDKVTNENYVRLGYCKFSDYNIIDFEDTDITEHKDMKNKITLGFKSDADFTIENSKKEKIIYNGETISGDIKAENIKCIVQGDSNSIYQVTIPYDEQLTYKGNDSETYLYVYDDNNYISIKGKDIDEAIIDLDEFVQVKGENGRSRSTDKRCKWKSL